MNRDWQVCLFAAVAVHAVALFGVQLEQRQSARPPADNIVEVMLVTAPAPGAPKTSPAVVPEPVFQPPPPVIPEETARFPIPDPVVEPEPEIRPEPVVAPPAILSPAPAALSQTKQAGSVGDGGSATPGLDATTQNAEFGVRVEAGYLRNPEPAYPAASRRRREEGLVLLTVHVCTRGHAAGVKLKESSGFPLLDRAAINAVRKWEFIPARLGDTAVESEITVPVRFKLVD